MMSQERGFQSKSLSTFIAIYFQEDRSYAVLGGVSIPMNNFNAVVRSGEIILYFLFPSNQCANESESSSTVLLFILYWSEQMIRIARIGFETKSKTCSKHLIHCYDYHSYSKSSLALKLYEWRFNLSFP